MHFFVFCFFGTNSQRHLFLSQCAAEVFNGVQAPLPSPPPPRDYKPETLFFGKLIGFP